MSDDDANAHNPGSPDVADEDIIREQDRLLPIANINRIMKMSLVPNAKIAKDAKECVQECVSEFISFITSEAAEKCATEKRKTVNGEDILFAMQTLGFDNYIEPLKMFLNHYRDESDGQDGAASKREDVADDQVSPIVYVQYRGNDQYQRMVDPRMDPRMDPRIGFPESQEHVSYVNYPTM